VSPGSPQETGFIATVSNPALRRLRVRRAVAKVFPASVSVPVMKKFMSRKQDFRLKTVRLEF
jgi:hypothetical protein